MPLREPEPIAGIVLMKVVNPRAPHAGETGRIVEIIRQSEEMTLIKLQFGDETQMYERIELELVMP